MEKIQRKIMIENDLYTTTPVTNPVQQCEMVKMREKEKKNSWRKMNTLLAFFLLSFSVLARIMITLQTDVRAQTIDAHNLTADAN